MAALRERPADMAAVADALSVGRGVLNLSQKSLEDLAVSKLAVLLQVCFPSPPRHPRICFLRFVFVRPVACVCVCVPIMLCGRCQRTFGWLLFLHGSQDNLSVTALNLCENNISYQGAQALGRMLATNVALTDLNVAENGLRDIGLLTLVSSLSTNHTLTKLDLRNNFLCEAGALGLAHALKDAQGLGITPSLTDVNLAQNVVLDSGAAALASVMPPLTALNLSFNHLGPAAAHAFRHALRSCPPRTITLLNLNGNHIDPDTQEQLSAAWEEVQGFSAYGRWGILSL